MENMGASEGKKNQRKEEEVPPESDDPGYPLSRAWASSAGFFLGFDLRGGRLLFFFQTTSGDPSGRA